MTLKSRIEWLEANRPPTGKSILERVAAVPEAQQADMLAIMTEEELHLLLNACYQEMEALESPL